MDKYKTYGIGFLIGAVLCAWPVAAADSTQQPQATRPKAHALLVGCTRYPYLSDKDLQGPANDIAQWSKLLSSGRLGFDLKSLTQLVGWPADAANRPTRKNIVQGFTVLAQTVERGDQVVIVLAGHGTQQPVTKQRAHEEVDGLDEVFLPADVRGWNSEKKQVENAITDDEIAGWLRAIRKRGAFVWFVADSCNSGTLIRGAPETVQRERRVPASGLVPAKELARAHRLATKTRGANGRESRAWDHPMALDGVVAMYASQPNEITIERPLPEGSPKAKPHGLFSYTLLEVLGQRESSLTYRELAELINRRYRSRGYTVARPMAEGADLDREVLGVRTWPKRPRLLLGQRDGNSGPFPLLAGDLHGLTPGSVLAVYPPATTEKAEQRLGYVQVVETNLGQSLVQPVEFGGRRALAAEKLVAGSRCSVVYVDYGDLTTRVALQSQSRKGKTATFVTHAPGKGPAQIEGALAQIEKRPDRLLRRVPAAEDADWLLRVVGDRVLLIAASGAPSGNEELDAIQQFGLKVGLESEDLPKELTDAMQRIARAQYLLRLAEVQRPTIANSTQPSLEVELLRSDGRSSREVVYGSRGRVLEVGDGVQFRIKNTSKVSLDISALFVNSGAGIRAVFPQGGRADNRLAPGAEIIIPDKPGTVTDTTLGAEQLVVIGVASGRTRVDFTILQQPTLPRVRSTEGDPLKRLVASVFRGDAVTRRLSAGDAANYTIQLLDWTTVKPRSSPRSKTGR